jgi:D-alanyl-D-alanine carboxypeptidase (penicillin-binding protein 5/6)
VGVGTSLAYQVLSSSWSNAGTPPSRIAPTERGAVRGVIAAGIRWPTYGQAAVQLGQSPVRIGPNQHAAPVASLAKVMTAYLVLRDHPLGLGEGGPSITLTESDVVDTDRRSRNRESIVPIVAGERLTERQALQALLLPSANNIAAVLATWDSGSVSRFVARMNATAHAFAMTSTRYTDPSGYDDRTVSTAADQLRIIDQAMRVPAFAEIVAGPRAMLPVAGVVHNTNTLLGRYGFVGVKTGSDKAAGGCFAFRAIRLVHGKRTMITGVVLGQPGYDLIDAGLVGGESIVEAISGDRAAPGAPRPVPAQGAPPREHAGGEPVSAQTPNKEDTREETSRAAWHPRNSRHSRRDRCRLWRREKR